MLEMEGVYAPSYEIDFLKTTIFHHPEEFGRKIRLVFNIKLILPQEKNNTGKKFPKEIKIFINTNTGIKITNIEDLSHKMEKKYSEEIGACWDPTELNRFVITNIPENEERLEEKFPHYFNRKSGKIMLNLKFEEKSIKENKKNNEEENKKNNEEENKKNNEEENKKNNGKKGMLFFAIDLEGNFLEEDSWWKKLLGISSYAWEFPYVFWSHNEKSLIPAESIKKCKEAQIFVIIPATMIKSINRVSCIPGCNHLHEMKDNDISTFCEFEDNEKSVENIKKWINPGSFSLAWDFSNTLKISKKIVLGHLDAYPRATSTLIFFFVIFLCLAFLFSSSDRFDISTDDFKSIILSSLIIFVIFYLFITGINYSFHSIRKSQLRRGIYETISIILACLLISLGMQSAKVWDFIVKKTAEVSEFPILLIMFLATLSIFIYFSYEKEKSLSIYGSNLTTALIIIMHISVIFIISLLLAYFFGFENNSINVERYRIITRYWAFNNLYGTVGIEGLEKLIK